MREMKYLEEQLPIDDTKMLDGWLLSRNFVMHCREVCTEIDFRVSEEDK